MADAFFAGALGVGLAGVFFTGALGAGFAGAFFTGALGAGFAGAFFAGALGAGFAGAFFTDTFDETDFWGAAVFLLFFFTGTAFFGATVFLTALPFPAFVELFKIFFAIFQHLIVIFYDDDKSIYHSGNVKSSVKRQNPENNVIAANSGSG